MGGMRHPHGGTQSISFSVRFSHSVFLALGPTSHSGCSSPPGKNQCPRSSTLDPEEGEGRTLPKYSQAQKNQAKLGPSVPLGKSEAMINVRTFPGSPSTIRYDTTRDTHTSTPESQKLRRPLIHGCTLYFFLLAPCQNIRSNKLQLRKLKSNAPYRL